MSSKSVILKRNDFFSNNATPFYSKSNREKLENIGLNYNDENILSVIKKVSRSTHHSHWRHLFLRIIFFVPIMSLCIFSLSIDFENGIENTRVDLVLLPLYIVLIILLYLLRALIVNIKGWIIMKNRTQALLQMENSKNQENLKFRLTLFLHLKITKNPNTLSSINDTSSLYSQAILFNSTPSDNLEIVSIFNLPTKVCFNCCTCSNDYQYSGEKIYYCEESNECIRKLNILCQKARKIKARKVKSIPIYLSFLFFLFLMTISYYYKYFTSKRKDHLNSLFSSMAIILFGLFIILIICISAVYSWIKEEKILRLYFEKKNMKLIETRFFLHVRNVCESVAVVELNRSCSFQEFENQRNSFQNILG